MRTEIHFFWEPDGDSRMEISASIGMTPVVVGEINKPHDKWIAYLNGKRIGEFVESGDAAEAVEKQIKRG